MIGTGALVSVQALSLVLLIQIARESLDHLTRGSYHLMNDAKEFNDCLFIVAFALIVFTMLEPITGGSGSNEA